jgi:hypothetical protein
LLAERHSRLSNTCSSNVKFHGSGRRRRHAAAAAVVSACDRLRYVERRTTRPTPHPRERGRDAFHPAWPILEHPRALHTPPLCEQRLGLDRLRLREATPLCQRRHRHKPRPAVATPDSELGYVCAGNPATGKSDSNVVPPADISQSFGEHPHRSELIPRHPKVLTWDPIKVGSDDFHLPRVTRSADIWSLGPERVAQHSSFV